FFSSRRRHTRCLSDWSSDVCSSDLGAERRVRRAFADRGVAAERIRIVVSSESRLAHGVPYDEIDLALDTFPFPGIAQTCESLWMGVPVVTLAGQHSAARVDASIVASAGLPELVAHSPDAYVRLAVEWSGDLERLADLRATLRDRLSKSTLMD